MIFFKGQKADPRTGANRDAADPDFFLTRCEGVVHACPKWQAWMREKQPLETT